MPKCRKPTSHVVLWLLKALSVPTSPAAGNPQSQRSNDLYSRRDTAWFSTLSAQTIICRACLTRLWVVGFASADAQYWPVWRFMARATSASLEALRGEKTVQIATSICWSTWTKELGCLTWNLYVGGCRRSLAYRLTLPRQTASDLEFERKLNARPSQFEFTKRRRAARWRFFAIEFYFSVYFSNSDELSCIAMYGRGQCAQETKGFWSALYCHERPPTR